MRETALATLVLSLLPVLGAQTAPADWIFVKDAKGACQIAVPPEWEPLSETAGAAIFRDATTAIAAVTNQPGQAFKPLTANMIKVLGIRKLFENSAKRIFYQDKVSRNAEESNAYSASVPHKNGTCSCHVVVLPAVPEETAKRIASSLAPAEDQKLSTYAAPRQR